MAGEHTPRGLLVDDDDGVRDLVATVLQVDGWTVIEAADGVAASRTLEERAQSRGHLCCILLDLMMPGIDGLAVLRYLQEYPSPPPAIAMSADTPALAEARRTGAVDAIVKPFDLVTLRAALTRYGTCTPAP